MQARGTFGRWMQKRADLIEEDVETFPPFGSVKFREFVAHNSHTPVYPLHTTKISDLLSDEEILSLWSLQLSL